MTYQRRLDVNEPDVIDSPYPPPPRVNVSQGDPAWPLQRSLSTPAAAQIPLQTKSGEKRKNKLGYSRTPVACGPCRHRKIRCVPSQSDPQGSCENCTRLNKECTFLQGDSQQDSDPSSSEPASQRAESTVPSNASPPDVRGEAYLRSSSQQGYQSPGSLPSSGWPQPSPSLAAMSSDRDDMYAVPLPSASSQQVHFTLSHPSAPTYVTSGMPTYMYGGAMQSSGGWQPQQTSSPTHEYDQGSPFDAMYGRAAASPYGAAPLRSMSYSGEASGPNNLQQYSPGHHQLPYQAVHAHGMTSPVPMSSPYSSVVPTQAPPPGQAYGMMEGQQQGQYQDANSYPADWTYQQRDQDPEAT